MQKFFIKYNIVLKNFLELMRAKFGPKRALDGLASCL